MGGSIERHGNKTVAAEANDSHAGRIVFDSFNDIKKNIIQKY